MRLYRFLIFLPALAISCSSFEKRKAEFADRPGDEKLFFMAYFPYLTDQERDRFLQSSILNSSTLAELRSVDEDQPEPAPLPAFEDIPKAARIQRLRIEGVPHEQGFIVGAYAKWSNLEQEVDVTPWISWKAVSEFARFERANKNELEVLCGVGDIAVEAEFLDQARGEARLQSRKSVEQLLVEVDAKGDNLEQSNHQKARAIAYCTDGTHSEISCGASWSVERGASMIRACGKIQVHEEPVQVKATYGGRAVTSDLYFGRRP